MIVFSNLYQCLRRHTANPGAGGAGFAAVDQDEALACWPHPAGCIEAGCAGAEDGNVDCFFCHVETPEEMIGHRDLNLGILPTERDILACPILRFLLI
jgi:hypothetical protein